MTASRISKSCRIDRKDLAASREPSCMNVVQVDLSHDVRVGAARQLFAFDGAELAISCIKTRCYDVSADGKFFYAVWGEPPRPVPVTHINLIENWLEELKARVPPAR